MGRATAAALAEHHLVADLLARTADGPSGAEGPVAGVSAGDRRRPGALSPAGRGPGGDSPEGLRARGWDGRRGRRLPHGARPPAAAELVDAAGGADVITFTSPSAVQAYLAARRRAADPLPCPRWSPASAPSTAEAARRAPAPVGDRVAARATAEALVGGASPPTCGAARAPGS